MSVCRNFYFSFFVLKFQTRWSSKWPTTIARARALGTSRLTGTSPRWQRRWANTRQPSQGWPWMPRSWERIGQQWVVLVMAGKTWQPFRTSKRGSDLFRGGRSSPWGASRINRLLGEEGNPPEGWLQVQACSSQASSHWAREWSCWGWNSPPLTCTGHLTCGPRWCS